MNVADLPCDFDAFVAQRRGIARELAAQLIEHWLAGSASPARRERGREAARSAGRAGRRP